MKQENETAAICGLYCGTCPSFGADCNGCLSDKVAFGCDVCGNGFRDCARIHKVVRCYECSEFPCSRLQSFSKKHIVNGICHHEHVIEHLKDMKEVGVDAWAEKQREAHTCKICSRIIPWFEKECSHCKQ